MNMIERKLNITKHLISNSSDCAINSTSSYTSANVVTRKRTRNITMEKDVLKTAVSQSQAKHLKSH